MRLAITPGDAAGVGPELVCQALAQGALGEVLLFADLRAMARAAQVVGAPLSFHPVAHPLEAAPEGHVPLWPVPIAGDLPPFGQVHAAAGAAALAAVDLAADACARGELAALVTGPVHKQAVRRTAPHFIGHTEHLAQRFQAEVGMLLVVGPYRALHLTDHVSVREALDRITLPRVLRMLRLAHQALPAFGAAGGTVAVMGLNPHAGEGGAFGREEIEVLAPAIAQACDAGLPTAGPFSPDGLLPRLATGEFAMALSMLHDHTHPALKLVGRDQGVNVTLGLPFVRTSVDHGTAFDLAGSGRAEVGSLLAAVDLARRLAAARA